jgi:NTE family protein
MPNQTSQQTEVAAKTLQAAQTEIARQIGLSTAKWSDQLAHPIPLKNGPGVGKERGLVLGGGGAYLLAWTIGYFRALKKNGVDLNTTDVVVGTSAGSLAATILTSGSLDRFKSELDFFAEFPKIFTKLVPAMKSNPSQARARHMAVAANDFRPSTIQAIGHAAMASHNPDGPEKYFNVMKEILLRTQWPSPRVHTTAIDCYTGERLVVSQSSGIPVNVACAASSSLPGAMGPTWLHDRLCMDGGICQTSTHSDVVSGVKRALVFSLSDGGTDAVKQGLRTSGMPNTLQQEIKDLEAGGTQTKLVVCGLLPGQTSVNSIMDPQWIGPMLKYGFERGLADASMMKAFWN